MGVLSLLHRGGYGFHDVGECDKSWRASFSFPEERCLDLRLLTRPAGAAIKIVSSFVLLLKGRIPNTKKTSRKLQLEPPTPSCIANDADRATFCIFQEDQMYFPLGLTFPYAVIPSDTELVFGLPG